MNPSQLYNNKIQKNTLCLSSNSNQRDSVLMVWMAAPTSAALSFMILSVGLPILETKWRRENLNKNLCKEFTLILKAASQSSRLQAYKYHCPCWGNEAQVYKSLPTQKKVKHIHISAAWFGSPTVDFQSYQASTVYLGYPLMRC